MTYQATIQDFSGPCYDKEAVMIYVDDRDLFERKHHQDVSLPREIVGTVVFTATMVGTILFVLCNFVL